jgi:hypothetical protein
MDELEWLKAKSPSTQPSQETTQKHRTQLRAAIAAEGADTRRPRRLRTRPRVRHRVLVTALTVVALCAVGAGIVALGAGDDGDRRVGAPAASGSTSSTTAPTCTGPLPANFAIPAEFGSGEAGPAPGSSDAVESGQQVTHWSSDQATFEVRWPADEKLRQSLGTSPQQPDSQESSASADSDATVDAKGVARRRTTFTFVKEPPECQTVEVTVYGTDPDIVNALDTTFLQRPYRSSEPLVTTTKAADTAPSVSPCPGPEQVVASATKVSEVKFVATVSGSVSRGTFADPEDALADFLAVGGHFIQRGYQELQLSDGSLSFVAEPRPGVVVTVVHAIPARDGWTVSDWSASGC